MKKHADMIGQTFGRWSVLSFSHRGEGGHARYLCLCECGKTKDVDFYTLKNGTSVSCGCLRDEKTAKRRTKHGAARSKIHMIWCSMRGRCNNPTNKGFKYYGARGIKVCSRWDDFSAFLEDMGPTWADGLSIDRLDVNGNYEPINCIWIPRGDQSRNRRSGSGWKFKEEAISTSTSGVRGVSWDKRLEKWVGAIVVNNRSKYLGAFLTKEDAGLVYQAAARELRSKCELPSQEAPISPEV